MLGCAVMRETIQQNQVLDKMFKSMFKGVIFFIWEK